MTLVVTSGALGFNPFSVVKSAVRAGARVVTDPNVQRAAVAAGQQVAPEQYAQITTQANRAAGYYRMLRPPAPGMLPPPPPPQPDTDAGPDVGPGGTKPQHGISKTVLFIGIGVVAFLLLTKK